MNKKDPFDDIIRNLTEILEKTRENAAEPFSDKPIDPELLKQLAGLENFVAQMHTEAVQELEKKNITSDDMQKILFNDEEKEKMSPENKAILEKTALVNREALSMKYALSMSRYMKLNASRKQFDKKKASTEEVKKRKGKFKNMGGSDKWKRL